MKKARVGTLAGIELLADLPVEEVGALQRKCDWLSFDQDEQILDRERDSRDVFFGGACICGCSGSTCHQIIGPFAKMSKKSASYVLSLLSFLCTALYILRA